MSKKLEISYEGKPYSGEIKSESNESLICTISQDCILNFEGKITLKEIYSQIPYFDEYTAQEILNILIEIEKDKFEIINSSGKLKLKIAIKVLKKFKELFINLEPKFESKEKILKNLMKRIINNTKKIENLEKN